MKKPILIINTERYMDAKEVQEFEDKLKTYESFKDFELVVFSGCHATIYYPPKEDKKDEPQPK